MKRRARVLLPLEVALALALGCSGTAKHKTGLPGGEPCQGPLSVVGSSCPAMFDGTLAPIPCAPYASQTVFQCDEGILLLQSAGSRPAWCLYDSTSHALIGATLVADQPVFCNDRTYQQVAGTQPNPACALTPAVTTRSCSMLDGGADGAATDGAATDGAATDGAATDGAATDGAATDGVATDGAADGAYERPGSPDAAGGETASDGGVADVVSE
jgi:hypothetical protein